MGIDYKTFLHLNPTKLKYFQKGYEIEWKNKMKEQEIIAYWNYVYTVKAVGCCFSKKEKFLDKPIEFLKNERVEVTKELTEEQIQEERQNLFNMLSLMKTNFESNKKK